jgi:hypothetical protein
VSSERSADTDRRFDRRHGPDEHGGEAITSVFDHLPAGRPDVRADDLIVV